MKKALLFSSGITAIVVGVFALAYLTSAATTKYAFTGRGIAKEHDFAGKNMRVYFTQLSERARALGLGVSLDVSMGAAKIYKRGSDGALRRIRQGNIGIGDDISIKGTVKSDDRFVASQVILLDTSFVITGKLRTYDATNRRMTIEVVSSTYRPTIYNTKTVTFIFSTSPSTKFYSRGVAKQLDEVVAKDQNVKVEGKVVNGTDFEVSSLNENVS